MIELKRCQFGFSKWGFLLVLGFLAVSPGCALAETGWQVTQVGPSCPMGAGTIVTVSSNGMRVTGPNGRIVLITTGPAWNVILINSAARLVYQTTLNDWLKNSQSEKHASLDGATWKRGATENLARMRAYSFIMDKRPARAPVARDGTLLPPVRSATLWVAQDIATSPTISNLFARMYGIPDCQRLPLRLSTAAGNDVRESAALDTVSARPVAITSEMFLSPNGYKRVSSYLDVITGSSETDDLKKLLRD